MLHGPIFQGHLSGWRHYGEPAFLQVTVVLNGPRYFDLCRTSLLWILRCWVRLIRVVARIEFTVQQSNNFSVRHTQTSPIYLNFKPLS